MIKKTYIYTILKYYFINLPLNAPMSILPRPRSHVEFESMPDRVRIDK